MFMRRFSQFSDVFFSASKFTIPDMYFPISYPWSGKLNPFVVSHQLLGKAHKAPPGGYVWSLRFD